MALIHEDSPALRRMAVFDVVVNNADRKGGHILAMVGGHRHGRQSGDARRLLAGTQHHDAPFQKIEISQPREGYPGSNNAQQPCQYRCFCKTQSGPGNIIKSSVKVQFVKRYNCQKRDECDRDLNRHNSKIGERFVVIKPTQRHNANRQNARSRAGSRTRMPLAGTTSSPLNSERSQTKNIKITSQRASSKTEAGMKCRNTLSIMTASPLDLPRVKKANPV